MLLEEILINNLDKIRDTLQQQVEKYFDEPEQKYIFFEGIKTGFKVAVNLYDQLAAAGRELQNIEFDYDTDLNNIIEKMFKNK